MDILILLKAALLGIVEGLTEFLPISSTGHLLIAEHWLGEQSELFNVVIQAGAILAVVLIYRSRLYQLITGFNKPENRDYALKLATAFLITSVLGFVATRFGFKLSAEISPIAWALIIGGVWMIAAEWMTARLPERAAITWRVAILVGLAQVVAGIFPGTSRSAATIFVAMLAGANNRAVATEFAFLLGIPTMFAASGYELLKAFKAGDVVGYNENWIALTVAFVVSLITAFVSVKWLLGYIRAHRFTPFAIYRIALGAVLLLWLSADV
ncbi:MAG: undecaprenyl-diphosphate phosphatase [Chromatiales bacterium]|jgi:undecaprenyl-diphosphatase|nr:undecaprenyl-diphosphate phosphatase [Chromatiales bacterium]